MHCTASTSEQAPVAVSQQEPRHGLLGVQVVAPGTMMPLHWLGVGTIEQPPVLLQQTKPVGVHGSGLQVTPGKKVPVHWVDGAMKQPAAAVQHAPVTGPQGFAEQVWPMSAGLPVRRQRSGLVMTHEVPQQQAAGGAVGAQAEVPVQVPPGMKEKPPRLEQFCPEVTTQMTCARLTLV